MARKSWYRHLCFSEHANTIVYVHSSQLLIISWSSIPDPFLSQSTRITSRATGCSKTNLILMIVKLYVKSSHLSHLFYRWISISIDNGAFFCLRRFTLLSISVASNKNFPSFSCGAGLHNETDVLVTSALIPSVGL